MLSPEITGDMVFVRHAESQFNAETILYVERKQIVYDWQHLSKDHEYLAQHKYSFHLVDAPITLKGHQECEKARKELELYNPDLILVSPLNRALQTCSRIFPNPKCPVIVEPILAEAIRSSCDLSSAIAAKKEIYPDYNFQKVQKLGAFWFIQNQSEENQSAYRKIIAQNEEKSYEQILSALLGFMLETWIYETATSLRRRTDRVKELLRQYRKQYKRIAVVSHYNIIRFSLAKEFNQRDEPQHNHIANCEVLPAEIANL